MRPRAEQRSAVDAQRRPPQSEPRPETACREARSHWQLRTTSDGGCVSLSGLQSGSLVVAPRETEGVTLLPGSLDGVLGVVADMVHERDEIALRRGNEGEMVAAASVFPRPIPDVPRERNLSGISFAVANVSGFLARALDGGDSAEHVVRYLCSIAD